MTRVFIIHGWGANQNSDWYHWLKQELKKKNFEVHALEMLNTNNPEIKEWAPYLEKAVGVPDNETYFIGNSIGCQTILRYLEKLPEKIKIGGAVLIAPWINLLETAYEAPEEEKMIAKPWLETSLDWKRIKSHCGKFVCIFSDNDFCVPLSDKEIFKINLDAKIIIEHNKGHFTEENKITEISVVLKAMVEMSKLQL